MALVDVSLMTCLGHVGSLKLKWKSNWNYMKTNQNTFCKYESYLGADYVETIIEKIIFIS